MPDLAEQIIELRIQFDPACVADRFPEEPGSGDEPPVFSVSLLVDHLVDMIRTASLYEEALRACEVDVLTVDHRTPPADPTDLDVPPDAFRKAGP